MKEILLAVFVLCFGAKGLQAQDVEFYNVSIVDVEQGKVIPAMTVLVKDGIIQKISKSDKRLKKGQIDCSGNFLMPGMIDSHSHWGNFGILPGWMKSQIATYLEAGVTTVRDAGGDERVVKNYLSQIDSGEIVGPMVYMSAFWNGPKYPGSHQEVSGWHSKTAPWSQIVCEETSAEEIERMLMETKKYGCTGIKLYNDISYATLKRIIPLCHKHGLKPWGHFALLPATAMDGVKAGVEVVSHAYMIDGISGNVEEVIAKRFTPEAMAARDSLYKEMIRRGTILDATTYVCILNDIPSNIIYTREAYQAGVKIAAGTDFVKPEDDRVQCLFLEELQTLQDSCGMSIPDILRAATVIGAEVVGQVGKLGVIKEGAEADLLLLQSNPLESLAALRSRKALYIDGKEIR